MAIGFYKNSYVLGIGLPIALIMALISFHFLKNKPIEYIIGGLVLFLVLFGYYEVGTNQALAIKKNKIYNYIVDTSPNNLSRLKFLGHMDNQYFFTDIDNNRIIIKLSPSELIINKYNSTDEKTAP